MTATFADALVTVKKIADGDPSSHLSHKDLSAIEAVARRLEKLEAIRTSVEEYGRLACLRTGARPSDPEMDLKLADIIIAAVDAGKAGVT